MRGEWIYLITKYECGVQGSPGSVLAALCPPPHPDMQAMFDNLQSCYYSQRKSLNTNTLTLFDVWLLAMQVSKDPEMILLKVKLIE